MRYLLLCLLLASPLTTKAAVTFSEIAWMGDTTSANYEWIELVNTGEAEDLAGWTISDGNNLTITLTGVMPGNSYRILERNRTTGEYLVDPPFFVYTGALVNTGATMTMRRADGSLVDQVAGGENWGSIGGDNTTKETAQLTSNGWRTALPTPGQPNSVTGTLPGTTSPAPVVGTTSDAATGPATRPASTAGNKNNSAEALKLVLPNNELKLKTTIQSTAYVGQSVPMEVFATGLGDSFLDSLVYRWNFGNLATATGKKVNHTFTRPGTYVVTVDARYNRYEQRALHTLTVLPVRLAVDRNSDGDILLHNNAPYDIDVSGLRVIGGTSLTFPPYSVMAAKSTLTLPMTQLAARFYTPIYVADPRGHTLAVWPQGEPVAAPSTNGVSRTTVTTNRVETAPFAAGLNLATTTVLGVASQPLVLRPPGVASRVEESIPAYVYRAFLPAPLGSTADASVPVRWPYYVFALVLILALGAVLATPPKPVSSKAETSLFTVPGNR